MQKRASITLRVILSCLWLLAATVTTPAQEDERPLPLLPAGSSVHERVTSNIRYYEDGRYVENVTRETRGQLRSVPTEVAGTFYVLESVIREGVSLGGRVDARVKVGLPQAATPTEWATQRALFPRLRPLPSLPFPLPRRGAVWEQFSTVVLQPDIRGAALILPVRLAFRFDGEDDFYGRRVYTATGSFRYAESTLAAPPSASPHGTHAVSIAFDRETLAPIFLRDHLDEEFVLHSGRTIGLRGFILHWYDFADARARTQVADTLADRLAAEPITDVEVVEQEEGVTLQISSLRFVADQATFLPGEGARLAEIARLLRSVDAPSILVVGHTADVGNPKGQQRLSEDRALAVVEVLKSNGIPPDLLIYEGRGATEPVASNATEEGRARNRRVEITILR